jgi:hypothetical protein
MQPLLLCGIVATAVLTVTPGAATAAPQPIPPLLGEPVLRACVCDKLSIAAKATDPTITAVPLANRERSVRVTIAVGWVTAIHCTEGDVPLCTGRFAPGKHSDGWELDGMPGAPEPKDPADPDRPGESHTMDGGDEAIQCSGACNALTPGEKASTYTVVVTKTKGGILTGSVKGHVQLTMAPTGCNPKDKPWTMELYFTVTKTKIPGTKRVEWVPEVDHAQSDYDGDGRKNAQEGGPRQPGRWTPDTDRDGADDGEDRFPLDPKRK